MSRLHLKGLDTYRAISVLVVFVCHVELFKSKFGMNNFLEYRFFKQNGGVTAIILFFTLSGFLITYLLLKEKIKSETINLKKFYQRRVYRVLPLYILILLISYLTMDYSPSWITLFLCLILAPNIAHAMGAGWGPSPQIWTIGVEVQFYIFGPLIIKKFKNLLPITIFLFLFLSILPHGILFCLNRFYPDQEIMNFINKLFYCAKFNCMACGAIFAVMYVQKSKIIHFVNERKYLSYILIAIPFILWCFAFQMKYFTEELYSLLFSISMLAMITNTSSFNVDTKIATFLNKISYGIYMYHWLILELMFRYKLFNTSNEIVANVLIYIGALSLTIGVSTLSYYYVERPFLRIKDKYY